MIVTPISPLSLETASGLGTIIVNIGTKGPGYTPIINFLAVILGASLAWLTSYQMEKFKQNKQDLATAYSLIFKIQHFVNEIVQIQRIFAASISEAEKAGATGPMWTKVVEISGFREDKYSISPDEMSLLARAKDVQLLMDVRDLESGHNIMTSSVLKLFELKKEFGRIAQGTTRDGRVFEFEVTSESNAEAVAILANLHDLSKNLEEMIPRVAEHAVKTADMIGPALKNHYKFKDFISIQANSPQA